MGGILASLSAITLFLTSLGVDFGFLVPLLAQALASFMASELLRLRYGLERQGTLAMTAGILLFSAYIVVDTNQIVKRYADDEYVAGALSLYLDIVNLFLELLQWFGKN